MTGTWKMRRVEIRKDHELQKVIDTGYQLWSFKKPSLLEISDANKIQNILHVKLGRSSIRSYDSKGVLQDEFQVMELAGDCCSLTSKKTLNDIQYDVVYYLDKIADTATKVLVKTQ